MGWNYLFIPKLQRFHRWNFVEVWEWISYFIPYIIIYIIITKKYPLSPLKPRFLVLIEQYLPNISDPVYSVHQSFMWFLRVNWRKSTFYSVTAPNDSKCLPIVTSSIQELAASNCDVTMTDCSRVVAMEAFLAQWNRKFITAQWSTENTSCFNFFVYFFLFLILWAPCMSDPDIKWDTETPVAV